MITYHDKEMSEKNEWRVSEQNIEQKEDYWTGVKTSDHIVSKAERHEDDEEMKINDIDELFGANHQS